MNCTDCDVAPGQRHVEGCSIARCNECGWQWLACDHNSLPSIWSGEYPGVAECREFGWFTHPDSIWGYTEDLNRLYSSPNVEWDKTLQRFVLCSG